MIGEVIDDPGSIESIVILWWRTTYSLLLTDYHAFDIPSRRWRYFCKFAFQPNRNSSHRRPSLEPIRAFQSCWAKLIYPCQSKSRFSSADSHCEWFWKERLWLKENVERLAMTSYLPAIHCRKTSWGHTFTVIMSHSWRFWNEYRKSLEKVFDWKQKTITGY